VINTEGEKITSAYPLTKELKEGQQFVETKLDGNTNLNRNKNQEKGQMQQQRKIKEEKKVL